MNITKLFIFVVTVFTVSFSYSQEINFGLKGGLNLATATNLNAGNTRARVGWNAGAFLEIPIEDVLLLRPEVLYSSKGFAFSATATSMAGIQKLNYIAVPVLFGYRASPKFSLFAGPEFGFLRKAVSKSQGITTDMTNFYRHFDIGADIGLAYNISNAFGIEARYNHGFNGLVNVATLDNAGNVIAQGKTGANRVIQLGIFYSLSQ